MSYKEIIKNTNGKAKYEQPKVEIYNFSDDIVQTSGEITGKPTFPPWWPIPTPRTIGN